MHKSFFRRPQFVVVMALIVLYFACDFGLALVLLDRVQSTPNLYYHHALKPNLSSEPLWGFTRYPQATDSLGLRDDEPRQVPLVGSHRRLLFLGDSFTEGIGVPNNQTFVGIIAHRIKQAGSDTEVFNGGVASHSPRLYLLHLQDLIEREGAKFDEIVVFIDVSDIQDELIYEDFTPGRFTLSFALRYFKQFSEQHSLLAHVLFNRLPLLQPYIDSLRMWMRKQQRATTSLNPVGHAAAAAEPAIPGPQRPPQAVWNNPNYYKDRDTWIDNDDAFRAWGVYGLKLARENLARLRDYAASKGMPISFAIYPWRRFALHPDNRGRTEWTKIAAEESWILADLYPDFAALPDPARLYIPGDVHWNAEGHQFVAEMWLAHYCKLRHPAWCGRLPTMVKRLVPP